MTYTVELTDEQIDALRKKACRLTGPEQAKKHGEEYYNADDASGGNFDDAYANGERDGDIEATRDLLDLLGICYSIKS